ncbi:MAG: M28 family peptidase, partial [Kangiellaceae bacterium]|nr:M28 family peptidase [Kangiellaceae bacterium]
KQLDPKTVVGMINIEMIGKPSKFGRGHLWMTGYDRSNLAELLNKNLDGTEFKVHQDPYPAQNLFYRSDNATLARLGVPAHSFSSSQIDIDKHYHQASDHVESLDLESMHQVIKTLANATQGLAAGKDNPTRVDVSQVKPAGTFF